MSPFALSLVLALGLAAQESKGIPRDLVEVEARGCLKGRVFTATGRPGDEGVSRGPDIIGRSFRVAAKRNVMDLVKRHNGHLVELVGIVRKSALGDEGTGFKVGSNTRVVIGARGGDPTSMNARTTVPAVATMDVTAVRFVAERCPVQ